MQRKIQRKIQRKRGREWGKKACKTTNNEVNIKVIEIKHGAED